jgi:regulatory protein
LQKLKPFAEAELAVKKSAVSDFDSVFDEQNHIDEAPICHTAIENIKVILDDFKTRGWLSDARFTEQIVHARKSKFGSARVANELREKGVADDLIDSAIASLKETEFDNALAICCKKYNSAPTSREDWARQARFLQSRGFGFDVIKKVLSSKLDSND